MLLFDKTYYDTVKMKDKIIIIMLIIWIVALPDSYQEMKDSLHIPKIWKFKTDDNQSFLKSEFNKPNWQTIQRDSLLDIMGYSDYNSRGWYNRQIVLPASYNNTYLITEYQIFLHK